MEWRDNNGKVVPHSSKSYSQDGAKLFHIEMTLLLQNRSQGNMTCYIRNPLIGEGKQTNIVIVGEYSAGVQLSIKRHEKINEIINVEKLCTLSSAI